MSVHKKESSAATAKEKRVQANVPKSKRLAGKKSLLHSLSTTGDKLLKDIDINVVSKYQRESSNEQSLKQDVETMDSKSFLGCLELKPVTVLKSTSANQIPSKNKGMNEVSTCVAKKSSANLENSVKQTNFVKEQNVIISKDLMNTCDELKGRRTRQQTIKDKTAVPGHDIKEMNNFADVTGSTITVSSNGREALAGKNIINIDQNEVEVCRVNKKTNDSVMNEHNSSIIYVKDINDKIIFSIDNTTKEQESKSKSHENLPVLPDLKRKSRKRLCTKSRKKLVCTQIIPNYIQNKENVLTNKQTTTTRKKPNVKGNLKHGTIINNMKSPELEKSNDLQLDKDIIVSKTEKEIEQITEVSKSGQIADNPVPSSDTSLDSVGGLIMEGKDELSSMQEMKSSNDDKKANMESENGSNNTVIFFRDSNKKITFDSEGVVQEEPKPGDLFVSVNATGNGRKRRYAKLLQNLEDKETSLDDKLKRVMDCENKTFDKGEASICMEKIKKKLCVRAKKKYESLINYQRCQTNEEQKSFENLLPEKAEVVIANIVKQLGGDKQEAKIPKKRGRPCKKKNPEGDNEQNNKKCVRKNKLKVEKNCVMRGFPRRFPHNLLRDSNGYNLDTIRLGIMYENGTKEVIELSDETLKGIDTQMKENSSSAENPMSMTNENEGTELHDNPSHIKSMKENLEGNESRPITNEDSQSVIISLAGKSDTAGGKENGNQASSSSSKPSTTIQLPSVSSLESDYHLISASYLKDGKLGNFKHDHFFIPQAAFHKGGQTGMVIVGPFCVKYDPKPHIILVPPKEQRKDLPMMILTSKADFSLSDSTEVSNNNVGDNSNPDHNYCSPLNMQESVKRFVRGIAKHSANARYIDARVESIQEGDGNSLVTLSGDNIFKKVKGIRQFPTAVPITSTQDGIPVVYNLTQIMTPVLKRVEMRTKREELVKKSKETGDFTQVLVPYEDMGEVAMEVLIPPCGTEVIPRTRGGRCFRSAGKISNFSLDDKISSLKSAMSLTVEGAGCRESGRNGPVSSNARNRIEVDSIGTWSIVVSESHEGTHVVCYSSAPGHQEMGCSTINPNVDFVPIENALDIDSGSTPGLACCRMCLRLFSNSYSLFSHVRSTHMTEENSNDSIPYLKELKAKSKVSCPICGPSVSYCTSLKLKKHLQTFHSEEFSVKDGTQSSSPVFSPTCSFCLMEFPTPHELSLHTQMAHGINSSAMDVSEGVSSGQNGMSTNDRGSSCFYNTDRSHWLDCLTCSRCNIIFEDRNSLVSHTLNVHPDLNQSSTFCRLCEREFDTESILLKHLRNFHKQTPSGAMQCLYCPAWLPNLEEASMHKISVHSGDVPVHCPFCGAGYHSMLSMYSHVRNQHLQMETLICPECQTIFPSARLLSDHAKKQHFLLPKAIKEYIKSVRTGSYGCPFCTISFSRTYDLAMHVVLQHKDPLLPAKCNFCLQSFVNEMVLKVHMAGAHGFLIDQGHQADGDREISYLHHRSCMGEGDGMVLDEDDEDDDDDFSIPESFSVTNKEVLSSLRHSLLLDPRNMMTSQDSSIDRYLQSYGNNGPRDTIVYADEGNQVVHMQDVGQGISVGGDIFDAVSTLEEVHLLDDSTDGYNMQGVDYLESTLSNNRGPVTENVNDVSMESMVNNNDGRGERGGHNVIQTTDDMLGQSLEVDGVLYQLAMAPEEVSRPLSLPMQDSGHQVVNMSTSDLTHLL